MLKVIILKLNRITILNYFKSHFNQIIGMKVRIFFLTISPGILQREVILKAVSIKIKTERLETNGGTLPSKILLSPLVIK